jgi:hypothetical protein
MNRYLFYPLLLCRLLNFSSNYFHVSRNLFIYKHAWDRIPETKNFERPSQEDIGAAPRLVAQRQKQDFLVFVTWVRVSVCMSVTPVISYLSTGLAGCSVDPGISCGARKLARTPRVTKKKKNTPIPVRRVLNISIAFS